jgi:hypothetical protein
MRTRRKLYALLVIGCLSVAAVFAFLATFRGGSEAQAIVPRKAVEVAKGSLGRGSSWSIWLFGNAKQGSCWITRASGKEGTKDTTLCGFSVPKRRWQPAARASTGSGSRRRSMMFILTRPNLDRLRVQLRGAHREKTIVFEVERLRPSQARAAGIPNNFGYSSTTFPGSIGCARSIEFVYRSGRTEHDKNGNC